MAGVRAPSRFTLITGMYPVSCGPAEHMRAWGKIPSWLRGFPAYLRQAGYFTANAAKTDYNSPIRIQDTWDMCGRNAGWRKTGPGPAVFQRCLITRSRTRAACSRKGAAAGFPAHRPSEDPHPALPARHAGDARRLGRYYDHMNLLDEQIATKLKALEDDGLADDTIVFYYSDNGGVLRASSVSWNNSGTHVPLIIYFPPKWRPPGARPARLPDPRSGQLSRTSRRPCSHWRA